MLWAADGSEILDYNGDMDESFEWSYLIGDANKPLDSPHRSLYARSYLYMENPPIMTYNILRSIIKTIKRIGTELTGGKQINVGATFDPGPEFAKSSFKYERHNEICLGCKRY